MKRLFISYARVDGNQLACRLADDLDGKGLAPWIDRTEITGGESWSKTIEDAIDRCDALIAVLTAGASASRICRGEQQRALNAGKRVVALLAQAGTNVPVYLQDRHYLDFSDLAAYDTKLAELVDHIERDQGLLRADLPARVQQRLVAGEPILSQMRAWRSRRITWAQVRELANAQRARFIDTLAGRGGAAGVYEPALYVARADCEADLQRFAEGTAHALMLIGDSGVGKTNVLCHWSAAQAAAGDALLVLSCDRLAQAAFEPELARDLGLEGTDALAEALPFIDELAAAAGRRLCVVFDGLNDFIGGGPDGQRALLTAIDNFIARLPGKQLRVVVATTTAAWHRMDREEQVKLTWARWYRARSDAEVVLLERFDAGEAQAAYRAYQAHFGLRLDYDELPESFKLRLQHPVLLRLLAETPRNGAEPGDAQAFDKLIFERYYEQRVRRREDQAFVDALAGEMLKQRRAALPLQPLLSHPELGATIADDSAGGAYAQLLDEGVLTEMRSADIFGDDLLKFSYPLVGAYAIARRSLRERRPAIDSVRELLAMAAELPLAWEAAATILVVRRDRDAFLLLAAAPDPEQRELAVEGLVRLQRIDREGTRAILDALLAANSPESQRTALRAAFGIGPDARDLLVRGALSEEPAVREAVRDTLYLIWNGIAQTQGEGRASAGYFIWRQAPDFTYRVMHELVDRLSWKSPLEAPRILGFVLDLTITIYINHCDRADVVQQTADIYHKLMVDRLHLPNMKLTPGLEKMVFRVVAAVFSDRLLHWMLVGSEAESRAFFKLRQAERAPLAQLIPLLDPAADIAPAEPLLSQLLRADADTFLGAATMVLAIHSHAHPGSTEPLVRRLFDALDARGRSWLLAGYSLLLPDAPRVWVPLLEELTPQVLVQAPHQVASLDIAYVPLGLAYGKQGRAMPLFEAMLGDVTRDPAVIARLVAGLGPVGFYHPQAVLATLKPNLAALMREPACRAALLSALATMRTLHRDPVDALLAQTAIDDGFQRQVAAAADVGSVRRFMRLLGYYNNAVHLCLHYPRMRRGLAATALKLLAESSSGGEFISGYAAQAIGMARDSQFDLLEWTKPDTENARS